MALPFVQCIDGRSSCSITGLVTIIKGSTIVVSMMSRRTMNEWHSRLTSHKFQYCPQPTYFPTSLQATTSFPLPSDPFTHPTLHPSNMAWPGTKPRSRQARKIQLSIPLSVSEYYSLRSQGLIQARSDNEWEHKASSYSSLSRCLPQDALALADAGELKVKVRFERVDWRRGFKPNIYGSGRL